MPAVPRPVDRRTHRSTDGRAGVSPETDADAGRRSLVPAVAGQSLWRAAVWTGSGAALGSIIVGIVAVAICWLPASGDSGSAGSALRAGALTFLAALHGGITVDGVSAAFVPLGLTLLAAAVAWRAGCGLADAAEELGETQPRHLLLAGLAQSAAFAMICTFAAILSSLGTSNVSPPAAFLAGFVLCAVFGGAALVRWSPLRDELDVRVPTWLRGAARAAAVGGAVYLSAGALLVAVSLIVNHDRVELLSARVGGGWSGVPVLLLGLLAAPNAVVAGTSYVAGPGFALGSGSHVSALSTAHGIVPAFPVLGAVPSGHGAPWPTWLLMALTVSGAGAGVARLTWQQPAARDRFRDIGATALILIIGGIVAAWLSGGGIGSGRLSTVGASPWQFGLAVGVVTGFVACVVAGAAVLYGRVRPRGKSATPTARPALGLVHTASEVSAPSGSLNATAVPDTEHVDRKRVAADRTATAGGTTQDAPPGTTQADQITEPLPGREGPLAG